MTLRNDEKYRVSPCICRKIYHEILPEKLGATYNRVIKWRIFFQPSKYATFDQRYHVDGAAKMTNLATMIRATRIMLTVHVVLKNHLRLIHGSVILDYIWTWFLGGDFSASIYGSRWFVLTQEENWTVKMLWKVVRCGIVYISVVCEWLWLCRFVAAWFTMNSQWKKAHLLSRTVKSCVFPGDLP